MLHLRLTWLKLTPDPVELQAAIRETQLLRVSSMSTAVLCVYLDSALDLPQMRAQSKPDPFAVLTVGKSSRQTGAIRRTDAPVWEQGFTFLVQNPENDSLQLKLIDQKTEKELGQLSYTLRHLLEKQHMEVVAQPFQLQRSGPTAKVLMSLTLKVLRPAGRQTNAPVAPTTSNVGVEVPVIAAVQNELESANVKLADFPIKLAEYPTSALQRLQSETDEGKEVLSSQLHSTLSKSVSIGSSSDEAPETQLIHRHRTTSNSSPSRPYNLGQIQLTLRYSIQRQRLTVIVHKIS